MRGLLYVRWASPDRVVAHFLDTLRACSSGDAAGTLLLSLATLLWRRHTMMVVVPVEHIMLSEDIMGADADAAAGAVFDSLRTVPWVSQWCHTEAVWGILSPELRRVGLCVGTHVPLFPVQCVLMARMDPWAGIGHIFKPVICFNFCARMRNVQK